MAEIKEIPIESYADCIEKAKIIEVHDFPSILIYVMEDDGEKFLLVQANNTFLKISA